MPFRFSYLINSTKKGFFTLQFLKSAYIFVGSLNNRYMDNTISILGWLTLGLLIAAFIISIIRKGNRQLLPIRIYIVVSIPTYLITNIISIRPINENYRNFGQLLININSILEIALIHIFLYTRIKSKLFRYIILIFFSVYFCVSSLIWLIVDKAFYSFSPDLFGIEGILILIPCLFYVFEILKSDLEIDLKSNPSFIVTCGLLFYFSITIPIWFSWYNLYYITMELNKTLLLAITISFIILIISFTKAFLCPIQNQQQ